MMKSQALESLAAAANRPMDVARRWKEATGGQVVGSFPMNFPSEIAHAAGLLPVIIQEADDPITVGHALLYPFYCGFTRSAVDQAGKGDLAVIDALIFGDHCVQLLGAGEVIRMQVPDARVVYFQLISSMCDPWTFGRARETFEKLKEEIEDVAGHAIADDALRASIRLFNKDRQLMRKLYDLRQSGRAGLSARHIQSVIKSSMVMDRAEHVGLLETLIAEIELDTAPHPAGVKLHLSGHFCQAPNLELLDMIESCGTIVVGDDLYHGFRYISTDIDETGDPIDAIAKWYLDRNTGVPCPTRVQNDVDWDGYLLKAMRDEGAEGMIVLMAKFCEPHMYYYPEIKKVFEAKGIPHLLIETEHESMALESLRTRVETFVEIIKRRQAALAELAVV